MAASHDRRQLDRLLEDPLVLLVAGGDDQIPRLQPGLLERIDHDQIGAAHRLLVELASIGPVAPHGVEVLARPDPPSLEDRPGGVGRGHHDVGTADGRLRRGDRLHGDPGGRLHLAAEGAEPLRIPSEHPDRGQRADHRDGDRLAAGLPAGADDAEDACISPREAARR